MSNEFTPVAGQVETDDHKIGSSLPAFRFSLCLPVRNPEPASFSLLFNIPAIFFK
jgi:hypothetical protein